MAASSTFLQSTIDETNQTTYTFSAQNLGTASADRYIIVGIGARSTGATTLSSVTIAGITATIAKEVENSTGGDTSLAAIVVAAVPTGTSGDIVATFSGDMLRAGIGVWQMNGADGSTESATASSVADAPSASLTIPADGVGFGAVYGTDIGTWAWTNLSEDYDTAGATEAITISGATSTSSGTATRTATFTATQFICAGVFVAYNQLEGGITRDARNLSSMGVG